MSALLTNSDDSAPGKGRKLYTYVVTPNYCVVNFPLSRDPTYYTCWGGPYGWGCPSILTSACINPGVNGYSWVWNPYLSTWYWSSAYNDGFSYPPNGRGLPWNSGYSDYYWWNWMPDYNQCYYIHAVCVYAQNNGAASTCASIHNDYWYNMRTSLWSLDCDPPIRPGSWYAGIG